MLEFQQTKGVCVYKIMFLVTNIFVMTKYVCCDKCFVTISILLSQQKTCLSWQTCVCHSTCLLWQMFCRNKHTFFMTKNMFCCDKHMFDMTNTCLSQQNFCHNKNDTVAAPANDKVQGECSNYPHGDCVALCPGFSWSFAANSFTWHHEGRYRVNAVMILMETV